MDYPISALLFGGDTAAYTSYKGLPEAVGIILLLALPFILKALLHIDINYHYRKYARSPIKTELTARQMLAAVIEKSSLSVRVSQTDGTLTDCFCADTGTIYLSSGVRNSDSPVSCAVALHEFGHALMWEKRRSFESFSLWARKCQFRFCIAGIPAALLYALLKLPVLDVTAVVLLGMFVLCTVSICVSEVSATCVALDMLAGMPLAPESIGACKNLLVKCLFTYIGEAFVQVSGAVVLLTIAAALAAGGKKRQNERV